MNDPAETMDKVRLYAGTLVVDAARSLALIAINTRPDPTGKVGEATLTALRVTEAARLLCAVNPAAPFQYLSDEEKADLTGLLDHYTPPPEDAE